MTEKRFIAIDGLRVIDVAVITGAYTFENCLYILFGREEGGRQEGKVETAYERLVLRYLYDNAIDDATRETISAMQVEIGWDEIEPPDPAQA